MELFWGEDFAGAGVAGGLEGGKEGFVAHCIFSYSAVFAGMLGMDFVGEALP